MNDNGTKISELTAFTTLADNDVLAGVDTSANTTKKVSLSLLKSYIDTNTTYTAGTNIDITNNVVSAPNVYNKTEVDTIIDTTADEINETIDENVEDLKNEVEALKTIYNAFPTATGTGTSASLDGTAEVTFKKLDLYGNTSQNTLTGRNLLKNTLEILKTNNSGGNWNGNKCTIFGVEFTVNDDLSITATGTATSNAYFYINRSSYELTTLPAGTYYFSTHETTGSNSTWKTKWNDGTDNNLYGEEKTKTYSEATALSFYIVVYEGYNPNGATFYPMIATTSGVDYEQYCGGTSSPNPYFPQRVEVVSGDNKICVTNKNLFTTLKLGAWTKRNTPFEVTYNNENEFVISSSNTGAYGYAYSAIASFPATIGKTYTLSYNVTNKTNTGTADADMVNLNATYVAPTNTPMGSKTITATEPYIYIYVQIGKQSGTAPSATITNIQIEEGSTASTYVAHEEKDYDINLPVENLFAPFEYTRTSNGVTFTYSLDGYINANGTASGTAISMLSSSASSYLITLKAGTYTISGGTNQVAIEVLNSSGTGLADTNYNYSKTFTISEQTQVFVRLKMDTGKSASDVKIYPMLEIGSKVNSYWAYGTTPLEMCEIGDYKDTFKKSIGKNIFKGDLELGAYNASSGNKSSSTSSFRNINPIPIEPNTTYIFSVGGVSKAINVLEYDSNMNYIGVLTGSAIPVNTSFTTSSNAKYINISKGKGDGDRYWQIEKGTTITGYEPFGVGIWYAYKKIGGRLYNGTESWVDNSSSEYYRFRINEPDSNLSSGRTITVSDYFYYLRVGSSEGGSFVSSHNVYVYPPQTLTTLTAFTEWLSTHNVRMYYPLQTPSGQDIPEILQQQLDELERAYSYENKTNVYQENNDKPFELDTEAIRSLKNILN